MYVQCQHRCMADHISTQVTHVLALRSYVLHSPHHDIHELSCHPHITVLYCTISLRSQSMIRACGPRGSHWTRWLTSCQMRRA